MVLPEIEVPCPYCGGSHAGWARFCPTKGDALNPVQQRCSVCQSLFAVDADTCPNCGTYVEPELPPVTTEQEESKPIHSEAEIVLPEPAPAKVEPVAQKGVKESLVDGVQSSQAKLGSSEAVAETTEIGQGADTADTKGHETPREKPEAVVDRQTLETVVAGRNFQAWIIAAAVLVSIGLFMVGYGWVRQQTPNPTQVSSNQAPVTAQATRSSLPSPTVQPTTQPAAVVKASTLAAYQPTPSQSPTAKPSSTATLTKVVPTQTPEDGFSLRWQVAFNSDRAGNDDIFLLSPGQEQPEQLTFEGAKQTSPAWSPDGQRILFQSNAGGDWELVELNLKNNNQKQMTNNNCDDFSGTYSPNGKQVAYYSKCDGNREIYVMDSDGSDRRQLTFTNGENVYNWFPVWSPDGDQIAYSSNAQGGKYRIWLVDTNGNNAKPVVNGCVPVFSPDGSRLVVSQYCSDYGEIFIYDLSDGDFTQITQDCSCKNAVWTLDGRQLLLQSDRTGNVELFLLDLTSLEMLQLTTASAHDAAPVPRPGSGPVSQNPPLEAERKRRSPSDDMMQVFIPAGNYLRGLTVKDQRTILQEMCSACPADALSDAPQREIYLDAFWIDQTEVTNAQFARFVQQTGYITTAEEKGSSYVIRPGYSAFVYETGADWRHPFGGGSSPNNDQAAVTQVSWDDAFAFCTWAGRRLPTEAEWEKAARGTDGRYFPWGNQMPGDQLLNFNLHSLGPVKVGSYPEGASPYGVLDMAGNVWEWVSDFYSADYYQTSPDANPQGPYYGEGHPLRGGSWSSELEIELMNVTSVMRLWNKPFIRSNVTGFRCANNTTQGIP